MNEENNDEIIESVIQEVNRETEAMNFKQISEAEKKLERRVTVQLKQTRPSINSNDVDKDLIYVKKDDDLNTILEESENQQDNQ